MQVANLVEPASHVVACVQRRARALHVLGYPQQRGSAQQVASQVGRRLMPRQPEIWQVAAFVFCLFLLLGEFALVVDECALSRGARTFRCLALSLGDLARLSLLPELLTELLLRNAGIPQRTGNENKRSRDDTRTSIAELSAMNFSAVSNLSDQNDDQREATRL